jgi:hypothetical protein
MRHSLPPILQHTLALGRCSYRAGRVMSITSRGVIAIRSRLGRDRPTRRFNEHLTDAAEIVIVATEGGDPELGDHLAPATGSVARLGNEGA